MQHIRTAIVFAFVFVLFCFLFFKKAYTANECTLEWFSLITCNSCILSFSGGGGWGRELLPIHSKWWSHNLQSDQQGSCQQICVLIVSITLQTIDSMVLRRNKNMAAQGRTVSHYYILVIHNFFGFMSLFRHSVWFSFSVKQFPSAEFGIYNI